jgi:hypothetical protein
VSDISSKSHKNWVPQIVTCGATALWQVYELMAPREAPSSAVTALELCLLACAVVGCFGGLAMHLSRR